MKKLLTKKIRPFIQAIVDNADRFVPDSIYGGGSLYFYFLKGNEDFRLSLNEDGTIWRWGLDMPNGVRYYEGQGRLSKAEQKLVGKVFKKKIKQDLADMEEERKKVIEEKKKAGEKAEEEVIKLLEGK